ncbi:kinetochore-associated protein DSN1 homolog [Colius striatus]|uniref:kinetochore-associated protein DSN1 homolog n=1 Tax=Colius striatus TaxID=57412 RepID=UPI002B1DF5D8|nr:kinetochore-associated protein DSN1 homolog [Colius striatus]
MAEPLVKGPGTDAEAAAAASPSPCGGSEEGSPGSAPPAAHGAGSDPGPEEKKADPEHFLKPPSGTAVGKKGPSPCETRVATRRRSHGSPSPRKSPLSPRLKRLSPWRDNPRRDQASSSFHLTPRLLVAAPQAKRRSWCRSSLKGTKRRRSLPPLHQDVTELSKSISLDLPETDRLSVLLLSSFQFSAQKLEQVLKQTEGFSPEAFSAHAQALAADLNRLVQKMRRDGTLQGCVEKPQGVVLDSALDESVAQVKEHMARFTAECESWDQLLLRFQQSAEATARQLEHSRKSPGQAEPPDYLHTSQAQVLGSKPNYQQILDEQGEVLSCVELAVDELQQAVRLLRAFGEDGRQRLRCLSEQLASRTFGRLEASPARKLLAAGPGPPPAR